ncbi:MAG: TolB-like 6-bladed beta-propeller domain-containing protein [Bacteroidales bacterium]|nr:TolB-like 6-bladed beta-propeller domain-containing protein [Bacteroidales bacterium]
MGKINFYIIIAIFICSCNSENNLDKSIKNITYDDFQSIENLDYEIVNLDSIWKPTQIFIEDNNLILIDKSQENFAQVFDFETKLKKCENITFGVGPNESLDCWSLQIMKDYILSFSIQTNQLMKYSKKDFLEKSHICNIATYEAKDYYPTAMVLLSNNNLVGASHIDTSNTITLFDSLGNKIDKHTPYPILESSKNYKDIENKFAFQNRIYYNDSNERIVVPYAFTDIFDIYDNDLNLISRVHGPIGFEPLMVERDNFLSPNSSTKRSCVLCCLTKKYIWCCYYEGKTAPDNPIPNQILVFDYEGNPFKVFNLNIDIYGLAVDEENNSIYAIAETPEFSIVKFNYK